jgi:2-polyprenyl-6-methoxyphenol hydroxylase-like FAD-dependent oxidoreductase
LVGCDGGRSTVRKLGGFDFPGTDAEFTGRQAMVEPADLERLPLGDWVHTATGSYVHAPVPGRLHTVEYGPATDRDIPVPGATYVLKQISGIGRHYDLPGDHPLIGRPAPDILLDDGTRLAEHSRRGRAILLGWAGQTGLSELVADWGDRVAVMTSSATDGHQGPSAALVRPDGYVAWAADGDLDLDAVEAALTTWTGSASPPSTSP